MSITINAPCNAVSFGQVSVAILRELHKRDLSYPIVPIGPVDLSTQRADEGFSKWFNACVGSAQQRTNRKHHSLKLWHISNSLDSLSNHGNDLLTFFELDQLTPTEINILKQQRKVYVTSRFTQGVFGQYGIPSVYVPLGFDAFNFAPLSNRPKVDGATSFLLAGKLEARKGHIQVLAAWAKRYGNRKEYRLNTALHNPFMKPEDLNAMIGRALEGKTYWNINWLPWSATNAEYNSVLQSSEIVIAMSGGEGRDLPCYHATALGAWPVAMRAHAYLDYLNDDNAILVSPNGKRPAADGVFFAPNGPFNVGNLFSFSTDDFYTACDEAEKRAKVGLNTNGMLLQKATYAETVDALMRELTS